MSGAIDLAAVMGGGSHLASYSSGFKKSSEREIIEKQKLMESGFY